MDLLFDQYADRLRRKGKSPHSVRAFTVAANRLERWLHAEGLQAETATFVALEDYFDGLALAPSSIGTEMRYIQAAYNYAVRRGTIRHNPALDLEAPKVPYEEPVTIPNDCLRTIRERIQYTRDWIFFHLLAYTGMRRQEIRELRWESVRLEEQTLHVVGKGDKPRLVPIHPALGEVLVEARNGSSFVVPSDGKKGVAIETIQAMSKRLSPHFTPHDYRRTVATSLRRNGVDTGIIDRIMGWAPASIFRRYYDSVADVELQRAILKLYADDPV